MKLALITYILLFLTTFNSLSENLAVPFEGQFKEHFSSNVPVSGNVLMGAVYSTATLGNNFFLNIANDVSHVCFKVASIDGTYVSENDYNTASISATDSTILLDYPTKFTKIVNNFSNEQLAPLATTGSCSDQRYQHVLLSSRSDTVESSDVLFMVSSGRSEVFMQLKHNNVRIKANCKRLESGKRTSYDTICKVPAASLVEDKYSAQIVRRKNGRSLPPTKFTIQKSK
ncbi:hypothetical protein [Psychrosphaera aestuarii]|uniref:hypothetical protein n=1 Tax=Psychrosphaera aestuarii TaxID=1266052 RepID=UPI001B325C37|nr:hypothetical protein [Psychrosphaera aestuarii]